MMVAIASFSILIALLLPSVVPIFLSGARLGASLALVGRAFTSVLVFVPLKFLAVGCSVVGASAVLAWVAPTPAFVGVMVISAAVVAVRK